MSHPVMPPLDVATLGRRNEIVAALRAICPDGVIDTPVGMKPYESDGLTAYRTVPLVVVLRKPWSRSPRFSPGATPTR